MKRTLRYLSLNAQATWHPQVEGQRQQLHSLTPITAVEVVLEHQRAAKPAPCVQIDQEVPGPGEHARATRRIQSAVLLVQGPALHAEARGNMLEPALLKATRNLENQVDARRLGVWNGGKANWNLVPSSAGSPNCGLVEKRQRDRCPTKFSLTDQRSNQ